MPTLAEIALSPETPMLVPLGLVCSLILALIGTTWRAANRIRDLTDQLKDMQRDVRASWTFRDHEQWALQLERENRHRNFHIFVPVVRRAEATEKQG